MLKIIQALPVVADLGGFGGPVSVAVSQSAELAARGHSVTLVGGWLGSGQPPTSLGGVPARLFPCKRVVPISAFGGTIAPGLTRWYIRQAVRPDILHVHTGRHLTSSLIGLRAIHDGVPTVVQTHGMLPSSGQVGVRAYDRLFTQRLIRQAAVILALTTEEAGSLTTQFGHGTRIEQINNGVAFQSPAFPLGRSQDAVLDILFMGRLHARKRPVQLVHAFAAVRQSGLRCRLTIVGPDEGEKTNILTAIRSLRLEADAEVVGAMPPEEAIQRIATADLLVLPSIAEPFPMSILEAMSTRTSVVVTTSCGLADLVKDWDAGYVTEPNVESVAQSITEAITDNETRQERLENAVRLVQGPLSIGSVIDRLEDIYRRVLR